MLGSGCFASLREVFAKMLEAGQCCPPPSAFQRGCAGVVSEAEHHYLSQVMLQAIARMNLMNNAAVQWLSYIVLVVILLATGISAIGPAVGF
jgi:hypothetical protein